MHLEPCARCKRHVSIGEPACPFCGAPIAASPPRAALVGRWSRAAIFAGAALAVPACGGSSSPRQTTTVSNTDADNVPPPAPGTGTIVVTVVEQRSASGLSSQWVRLLGGASPANQQVMTDNHGTAIFANLPPGTYQVIWTDRNPRNSPTTMTFVVKAGETTRQMMNVYMMPDNPSHQPMPYGAPPARRRIV